MIILDKFPIHMAKTNNKNVPNKYVKVNNQAIYNGSIGRFSRAIVVKNLHDYVASCIPTGFTVQTPTKILIEIHTVRNHGNIRRKKDGNISWKPPDAKYKATWDDDNLAFLWIKTIRDTLTEQGVWKDDNVDYVRGGGWDIKFVNHLDDRKIIIKFVSL